MIHLSAYGVIAFSVLALKFALARKRVFKSYKSFTVAVVVPVYNEDPAAFRECLNSILAAARTAGRYGSAVQVWVVDDGSTDLECYSYARQVASDANGLSVIRFTENRGKRHAMGSVFRMSMATIFMTVDSDTVVDRLAIAEGLKPFCNPKVMGVTGVVRALNPNENLLTRLIDIRYASAFLLDRLAQSAFGSVLCACGSLAFWRGSVVRANLDDFVNQTFLGVPVQYGDDRRMTNYALREGKVVVQPTARAKTLVPTRLGHFIRQQARWCRSFVRETLWSIRFLSPRRPGWWLSVFEGVSWAALSFGFVGGLVFHTHLPSSAWFLVGTAAIAYVRSIPYLLDRSKERSKATFALAPLYSLLTFTVLLPVKLYAMATVRTKSWGTRSTVEAHLKDGV